MDARSLLLALAAGLATFLVVGVVVTELAQPWIEFSLFLGLPAGLGAGTLVAAVVYLWRAADAPAGRRRVAASLASFGVAFLVVLLLVGALVNVGTALALIAAAVVGVLAAIASYLGWADG
jgi:hypothetical protein